MPTRRCPNCNSRFTKRTEPSKDVRRCTRCGHRDTEEAMADHDPYGRR